MSASLKNASPQKLKKNGITKPQSAKFALQNDKKGQFYHHPQKGKTKVIALFCNCGRSVLVKPSEAKGTSIMCGKCGSPFQWQQLSFSD